MTNYVYGLYFVILEQSCLSSVSMPSRHMPSALPALLLQPPSHPHNHVSHLSSLHRQFSNHHTVAASKGARKSFNAHQTAKLSVQSSASSGNTPIHGQTECIDLFLFIFLVSVMLRQSCPSIVVVLLAFRIK